MGKIWLSSPHMSGNEIKYVISNGELVIDNYKFTHVDVETLLKKVQTLSEMFYEYKQKVTAQKATGVREKE